jgi:hypothetical protein
MLLNCHSTDFIDVDRDHVTEAIKWNPDSYLAQVYMLVFDTVPEPY